MLHGMEIDMTNIKYALDELKNAFELANKESKKSLLIIDEYMSAFSNESLRKEANDKAKESTEALTEAVKEYEIQYDCSHSETYHDEDVDGTMYMACKDCHKVLDD